VDEDDDDVDEDNDDVDEDDDDVDEDNDDVDEDDDDTEEDGSEENDGGDANAYEQQLVEPVDALPDEVEPVDALPDEVEPVDALPDEVEPVDALPDEVEPVDALPDENENDLEVELPPLELVPTKPEVELFRLQEQSNYAYADAVTAYYEGNDYQRAIEKFGEAIEYEARSTEDSVIDANEIVAKSKYWQAEAYIKLQNLPQAIVTLEDLVETCQGHYLSLAAQRRVDQLNAKNS
jgi:tetratricopeptide (TPR) repeat protein